MKRSLPTLLALLVLAGAVWTGAAIIGQPAGSPGQVHSFLSNQEDCDACHEVEWKGSVGNLETDKFSASFVEVCARPCHEANLKRSHPVNVNPFKKRSKDQYPANLPLQFSRAEGAEILTCVTCHKPHSDRHSAEKLYARQREHPNSGGKYLTYYLRVRGQTAKEGYAPLCKACHPQL